MDQNLPPGSEQPATSGNRWEPTDAEPQPDPNPYAATEGTGTTETTAAVPPSRPTWLTRARAGLAGGAVAALLLGGLGGFAVGHATAGHDDGTVGFHDDHGFSDGGPGGPQLGQPPDGGQVPGMPGQDDGPQDDDGSDGSTT